MAIVMVVLGVLLGGLIVPLSTQQDTNKRRDAKLSLEETRDALLGYAAATGRMPCPATTASGGLSAPNAATSACTQFHGFVPGRTLGLTGPVDANNLPIDRWLNPIRYSLTSAGGGAYSNSITLALIPDFQVCSEGSCAVPIADNVVALVFSLGSDGTTTTSPDQLENIDGDVFFVRRTPTEAVGTEFDDELLWISPNVLTLQLVRAGQLN
jgi:type II secretory pathway pseudopilin PulG